MKNGSYDPYSDGFPQDGIEASSEFFSTSPETDIKTAPIDGQLMGGAPQQLPPPSVGDQEEMLLLPLGELPE